MTLSLPTAFAQIPRYSLLYPHPSPIHPLSILSSYVNSTPNPTPTTPAKKPSITLFAKREDHSSPLACAGNKYRKLEYIVPDILALHSQRNGTLPTLVTEGAIQSNHTVQVAAVANRLGLDAIVILHKGTGGGLAAATDKASFLRTGNVQVVRLLGAEVKVLEVPEQKDEEEDPIPGILDGLCAQGKAPYWIPSGASLHPLGGLGYARGAFEIAAQEHEQGLKGSGRFDYIFVACGSGSTVGGLIAGFKLLEKLEKDGSRMDARPRKVIGILNSPTKPRKYHEKRVLQFARRAAGLIGLNEQEISMDDVRLDDRFVGTAYGVLDAQTNAAMELMAKKEGVVLDPVYTAKVIRGLLHWVQHGDFVRDWALHWNGKHAEDPDQLNALFIHTGGQAALCAYAETDKSPEVGTK